MRRPVNAPYSITTTFGVSDPNSKFGRHTGVDYAKGIGSNVYATHNGTITQVIKGDKYNGNVVQLFDGQYYHRCMHLSTSLVSVGQKVSEGQVIARSGNTGLSSGPHVHWDICTQKVPTAFSQFYSPATWLAQPAPKPPAPKPKFPRTVTVVVPMVYVRSSPNTHASLAGSKMLKKGQQFLATGQVTGEKVAGNNIWFVSSLNHYVWSGACK